MAYQEKTVTGYGKRLSDAFKGIGIGLVVFVGGTALLFWNEGNFVKTKKALNEAEGVTVPCEDVSKLDPALDGKLIHASALADTKDVLEDAAFGVKEVAIALSRKVEYYQWVEQSETETKDKLGGGQEKVTTYTYEKAWQDAPVDSGQFKDADYRGKNFSLVQLASQKQYAKTVSFGAYSLPTFFIESITRGEPSAPNLPPEQVAAWETAIRDNPRVQIPPPADTNAPAPPLVHVDGGTVYFGVTPADPQVGDMRATLSKVPPQEVSIIAKVNGSTFTRYVAKNGKTISRLAHGAVSMEEMYASAHSANSMITWVLRVLGVILICGGLKMIFGLFEAIAKVVPFLGSIVGAGVGFVCTVLGLAWSFLWIAIAWLTYRPLVGVPLLAVSIALIVYVKMKSKKEVPST